MKNLCIIQARMGSNRLPGKMALDLAGQPALARVIQRVKQSNKTDKIVVATTTHPDDDRLAEICQENNIECFRGSQDDVLDRYYQAAKKFNPENIIRITGDCVMVDPDIIDQVITLFEEENLDYATNVIPHTYPDGLDAEIFKFEVLEKSWHEVKLESSREHVTIHMWKNPEIFKQKHLNSQVDLSARRWTLDNPEDYQVIQAVYNQLHPQKPEFRMNDLLEFFEQNPELEKINSNIQRNEGYTKSLQED